VILRSQANLVASLNATWSETAREAARVILSRIAAEEEARVNRDVRADLNAFPTEFVREAESLFGAAARYAGAREVVFSCPAKQVAGLADWLIGKGATRVTSAKYDYVFSADNSLWRRLSTRLSGRTQHS